MSTVGGGVNIVRDGLVMYLDAANTKSLADVPSQNLFTYSQQFDTWSKLRATITGTTLATTAPDGTSTAQKIIEDTTSGVTHFFSKAPTISGTGTTYTVSIYAKAAERTWLAIQIGGEDPNYITAYFDLINGVLGSVGTGITAAISNVGNGWYRCSITRLKQGTISSTIGGAFCISTTNLGFTYNGDGTSGIYVWGGQLEVGNVATTYIPTTTVPVSRTPTWVDLSKGGNNGTLTGGLTYNYSNGGGLVFNGTSTYVQVPFTPLGINATWTMSSWFKAGTQTIDNGIICFGFLPVIILRTDGNIRTLWYNGVTYPEIRTSGENYSNNVPHNVTVTYDGVTVKLYVDSILKNSNVSNVYTLYNSIRLGIEFNNGNKILNGIIYSGLVYTKALSASEVLQNYNTSKSKFGLL